MLEFVRYTNFVIIIIIIIIIHGSETWPVKKENGLALQWTEMRMMSWMCDVGSRVVSWDND